MKKRKPEINLTKEQLKKLEEKIDQNKIKNTDFNEIMKKILNASVLSRKIN